jgi:hypothetical protein
MIRTLGHGAGTEGSGRRVPHCTLRKGAQQLLRDVPVQPTQVGVLESIRGSAGRARRLGRGRRDRDKREVEPVNRDSRRYKSRLLELSLEDRVPPAPSRRHADQSDKRGAAMASDSGF